MKIKKKIFVAFIFFMILLVGCGSNSESEPEYKYDVGDNVTLICGVSCIRDVILSQDVGRSVTIATVEPNTKAVITERKVDGNNVYYKVRVTANGSTVSGWTLESNISN